MATPRVLRNPPITEAVVDFLARNEATPDQSRFDEFQRRVGTDYPTADDRLALEWRIDLGQPSPITKSLAGRLFKSADGTQVAQAKVDGFSFSRLPPYTSWDSTLDTAWRLWEIYRDVFRPIRVARVSTRYINRISLPGPAVDFDEYLTIGPRMPPNIPQFLASFNVAMAIPDLAPDTTCLLRAVHDGAPTSDLRVPVIVDIDVVRVCDLDPGDAVGLRDAIESLRSIKNAVFFGSLTEKGLEVLE
jgi:uncharacterized protein (TIGR04255 family)